MLSSVSRAKKERWPTKKRQNKLCGKSLDAISRYGHSAMLSNLEFRAVSPVRASLSDYRNYPRVTLLYLLTLAGGLVNGAFFESNCILAPVRTRASKSIHVVIAGVRYQFECKLSRRMFSKFSAISISPLETRTRRIEGLNWSRYSSLGGISRLPLFRKPPRVGFRKPLNLCNGKQPVQVFRKQKLSVVSGRFT